MDSLVDGESRFFVDSRDLTSNLLPHLLRTESFCFPDILPGCCPVCAGVLRRLYRCQALNSAGLDANIDILARECPLDCADFLAELDIDIDLGDGTNSTNSTNSTLF